jgi:hypothetical protein
MSHYVDLRVRVETGGPDADHCLKSLCSLLRRQCVTVGPFDAPFGIATVAAVMPIEESEQ